VGADDSWPMITDLGRQNSLERGIRHQWRVTAHLKDGVKEVVGGERGVFFVASAREVRALTPLKPLAEGTDAEGVLLAAAAVEAGGAYDGARACYRGRAELAPGEARFHLALARYYEAGGRPDLARQARERAGKLGLQTTGE